MTNDEMKKHLEGKLSGVAGHRVEITVRGERSLTVSFESVDEYAGNKIAAYLGCGEVVTDVECGMTAVYIDPK